MSGRTGSAPNGFSISKRIRSRPCRAHFYDSADLTRGVAATIVEGHGSGCYTLDDAAC